MAWHGKSSNSVYGSVPKTQPWEMHQLLKICSWNIRRGLIKRELELKDMLNSEKLNIMFLVETDTKLSNGKSDYKIEGYATVLQKTNQSTDKIRIIGLVEEDTLKYTKIREDLMSTEFPTIWFEIIRTVALREPVAIKIIGLLRKSIDQKDHLKVMSLKLNKPQLSSFLYLIL